MYKMKNIFNLITKFNEKHKMDDILKDCIIENINEDKVDLTIVSTVNNRSLQTYFSLKTWNYAAKICGKKFQYILVEDSKNDKLDIKKLNYTNLYITYVYVNNKLWENPCINYNIGFEFIKSENVVITNPEVCIFGNIYPVITNNLKDNNYLVFDVSEIGSSHCKENNNKLLLDKCDNRLSYNTIINFLKDKKTFVLQGESNNRRLHFLTCIKTNNLKKIGGFDTDFGLGFDYDDAIFLNKIIFMKLKILNIYHTNYKVLGIHQWHSRQNSLEYYNKNSHKRNINKQLYLFKIKNIHKDKYIEFKNYKTYDDLVQELK